MDSTPDASAQLAAPHSPNARIATQGRSALTSRVERFSARRYEALLYLFWLHRADGVRAIGAWRAAVEDSSTADKPRLPTVHKLWSTERGWFFTHVTEAA
jgi:hypothetical protein